MLKEKQMIKEIIYEKSSPEARGKRVRRLRNMANLSRQLMCQGEEFKLDTLIGWELARHGGLTEKGALKLINRLAREGVSCSVEWLMHELGTGPKIIANFVSTEENLPKKSTIAKNEDKYIIEELLLFKKHNQDSIELHVPDNCMAPVYNKDDYVAGIKCYQDKFQSIIGFDCIVRPSEGEILLRRLIKGNVLGHYTLLPINFSREQSPVILINVNLVFAAPVIWHRRKMPV